MLCTCTRNKIHPQHIILRDPECPSHLQHPEASQTTIRFNNLMAGEGYSPWPQHRRTV